jgi:hypothetical protein
MFSSLSPTHIAWFGTMICLNPKIWNDLHRRLSTPTRSPVDTVVFVYVYTSISPVDAMILLSWVLHEQLHVHVWLQTTKKSGRTSSVLLPGPPPFPRPLVTKLDRIHARINPSNFTILVINHVKRIRGHQHFIICKAAENKCPVPVTQCSDRV